MKVTPILHAQKVEKYGPQRPPKQPAILLGGRGVPYDIFLDVAAV
jgi:hypothetical protein